MVYLFELFGVVAVVSLAAVCAVQGFTLGRARCSAQVLLAASVLVVTVADSFRVGVFNGFHLLGVVTSVGLVGHLAVERPSAAGVVRR